jgi:Na+/phosphate symporter
VYCLFEVVIGRTMLVSWISCFIYPAISVNWQVRRHKLPVMFTSIRNAVLLFLRVLGVMCIVFRMLFTTMRSRVALIHMYFVILESFILFFVFLLLLYFTFQEIRCTWVMLPFPGRLLVLPRYWPCSWFIPLW